MKINVNVPINSASIFCGRLYKHHLVRDIAAAIQNSGCILNARILLNYVEAVKAWATIF